MSNEDREYLVLVIALFLATVSLFRVASCAEQMDRADTTIERRR